jgi:hypothetical protein
MLQTVISMSNGTGEREISAQVIQEQLKAIVNSSSFRTSKRYPRFLCYVTEKTLAGHGDDLKERLIGMEVFDRSPDYDPAADPCVRVAAGEIRKRLAQYYVQSGHETELRIDLPAGSYVPVFHWNPIPEPAADLTSDPIAAPETVSIHDSASEVIPSEPVVAVLQTPSRKMHWGIVVTAVVGVCALIGMVFLIQSWRSSHALSIFWSPVVENGSSTIVCVGDVNSVLKQGNPSRENQSFEETLKSVDHVGPNDAGVLARIASILGAKGRKFSVEISDRMALKELRTQPLVLIGGFDNPWTTRILANERFELKRDQNLGIGLITDAKQASRNDWSFNFKGPLSQVSRDFAIVARMVSPLTGQPVIVIAGLGPYGTMAASEFVSTPAFFAQFDRQAPKGWESRDVEIVIETDVVDAGFGAPHMVVYDLH